MENKTISTAEEISKIIIEEHINTISWDEGDLAKLEININKKLKEFAKLHVKAALKSASENAVIRYDHFDDMTSYLDEQSILKAYPDENIK